MLLQEGAVCTGGKGPQSSPIKGLIISAQDSAPHMLQAEHLGQAVDAILNLEISLFTQAGKL